MMSWLAQAMQPSGAGGVGFESLRALIAPYMGVFFVAFFVALLLTPLMRLLAMRNGIVDWPDLKRKNHIQPVAYLGGVSLFLGWLAAVMLCYFITPHAHGGAQPTSFVAFPVSVILGAGAVVVTGLLDDVYGMSARVKVGGQLFAAAALTVQDVGPQLVEHAMAMLNLGCPGWLAYTLGTLAVATFVIGGCNAMNLLDGMDGLAAGVASIAAAGFVVIAGLVALRGEGTATQHVLNDPVRLVMGLALLGTLLGFLPYNFKPATIFMGDAGSLLVGYLCISTILLFSSGESASLRVVTACLIVFALPIGDTSLAIFRRKMRGQSIFAPDSEHIHHLLRRGGMSVRQVVLTMYTMAGILAAIGVTIVWMDLRWHYVLAAFAVIYAFVIVTGYKYGQRYRLIDQQRTATAGAEPASEPIVDPADRDEPVTRTPPRAPDPAEHVKSGR